MRDFCITTDSNSDMPKEFIEKYNITILPQYYSFNDVIYGEELFMEPSEFYDKMKNGELPKSQANNPAVVEAKFRKILNEGKDIIHVAFSSALSGSYDIVQMVANELLEEYNDARITIIDSLNVSLGESLLVLYGYQKKNEGLSYDDVIKAIEDNKNNINVQFTVDDLFHLQRGGRINKTTAVIGSALQLKPFLYVNIDGGLSSDGNTRGRKKALRTLVDRMKSTITEETDYSQPVGIVHGNCIKDAEYVSAVIKSETQFNSIIINYISPSVGTHAGPGALGIIYFGTTKMDAKQN